MNNQRSWRRDASPIRIAGVVGAGQMGCGIAHVLAQAGLPVRLIDISEQALLLGKESIGHEIDRQIAKGKLAASKEEILNRIVAGSDYALLSDADLVIEAASEDEAVKRKIYAQLCPILKPEAYLVSNTSSISITRLGSATDRPTRFMGMHFMKPVTVMSLVELIRGIATGEDTFAAIRDLVTRIGKKSVSVEDFPAFIVNRILMSMINEAVYTLYEGVGSVDSIDTALRLGANHPMGPLELADFIGLDICLSIMQVLHEGLADSKYRPCPLLVKYVEAGWLGCKTKRGFYDYSGAEPVPTR